MKGDKVVQNDNKVWNWPFAVTFLDHDVTMEAAGPDEKVAAERATEQFQNDNPQHNQTKFTVRTEGYERTKIFDVYVKMVRSYTANEVKG
jgi:hypothetical protein